MFVVVILASGLGTRLSPLSTKEKPKQFLKLISENSLVKDTVNRVKNIVSLDNIFVVVNDRNKELAKADLSELNEENFIFEPEMKENLTSVTYATSYIKKLRGKDIDILFLPSDHYIKETNLFVKSIKEGLELLKEHNNIVLFGLKPASPNTNYGYINTLKLHNNYLITSFTEKPNIETAKEIYLKENYFWNSGIVLANSKMITNTLKEILPNQFNLVEGYITGKITRDDFFNLTYVSSFSKSVLENKKDMMLVYAKYTWYDIGNFDALFEVLKLLNKNDKIKEIETYIHKGDV